MEKSHLVHQSCEVESLCSPYTRGDKASERDTPGHTVLWQHQNLNPGCLRLQGLNFHLTCSLIPGFSAVKTLT